MTPREELDFMLKLIRKYNLPLSPILEYAVNEKKDGYKLSRKLVGDKRIVLRYEIGRIFCQPHHGSLL